MGARESAVCGSFGEDGVERSYVLQSVAGVSGGEGCEVNYKNVYLFVVRPRATLEWQYITFFPDLQERFFQFGRISKKNGLV
jgi:hypothetical protein